MPAGVGATVPVLVAAAGEPWESRALALVGRRGSGLAVHRRCVDRHDLVATAQASPVSALQPLMAQARDVGLHVVVARRTGGASRALYEPVIQSLRDLAMPGVMLSGPRDEGVLIGNLRPQPAPEGRARVVTRDGGTQTAQLAWLEPTM